MLIIIILVIVAILIVAAAVFVMKKGGGGSGGGGAGFAEPREAFHNPLYADATEGVDGAPAETDPGYMDVPLAGAENVEGLYDDQGYMDTAPADGAGASDGYMDTAPADEEDF